MDEVLDAIQASDIYRHCMFLLPIGPISREAIFSVYSNPNLPMNVITLFLAVHDTLHH